jgi:hypothetical protein
MPDNWAYFLARSSRSESGMGIQHSDGYSASVEAYLVVGDRRISVAKAGWDAVVLTEPCELLAGSTARLEVIVDGHLESKPILLDDGATGPHHTVRYSIVTAS